MLRSVDPTGRSRLRGLAPLLCTLLLGASACDDEAPSTESAEQMSERLDDVLPLADSTPAPLPRDREAALRELAPLPADSLLVVYEVEGPGGVGGSLEVLARPGGYRRENWAIVVPLGEEGERRLTGSTIQNPQGVWIEGADASTLVPSPLGAMADAMLSLEDGTRRAVVEQLAARRKTLDQARRDKGDSGEEILGVRCHTTRVATIEMCLWEATGLPLRYESEGLRLRAVSIDLDAGIGEHAFDLPFETEGVVPEGFDARDALLRLAQGDLAGLSPYLHPGLRLPSA